MQQVYYAGQLWLLDKDLDEALSYFDSIRFDYLPAAYMCLTIRHEQTDKVSKKIAKEIIRVERKNQRTGISFLKGIPEQNLNLERADFRMPFFYYAQYTEIKEGIGLLEYVVDDFKLDFDPIFPDTLKAFWYTWKLSPEQFQQIFEIAKKEGFRQRADALLEDRENILTFTAAGIATNESELATQIDAAASEKLRDAYDKLKSEPTPEAVENRLAGMMNDWTLPKAQYYRKLTSLFVLNGKLEESQKIYLDFFSVLQEYARKKPSDIFFAGLKADFKILVGHGVDALTAIIGLTGSFLNLLLKSFAKSSIAELMIQYLKQPNPKFKTYADFKVGFREFIGEEQKRLGTGFEQKYPLFGFEEWVG